MPRRLYVPPCWMTSDTAQPVPETSPILSIETRLTVEHGRIISVPEILIIRLGENQYSVRRSELLSVIDRLDGKEP